jgi:PAS domain S-box-containing protein
VQQYSTLGRTSTAEIGHYLTRVGPIVENGVVTSLVLVATDVTALEESRTLLQVALNATGLGIWTYEPGSGAGSWDATTQRIFGAEASNDLPDLRSMLGERVHAEDRALVRDGLAETMRTGRYGPLEHRITWPNGETRWVAASGIAISNPQGEVARIVGSVMDITHRRALEQRLLEAQKLESIGRLAGGVAHDFNNMLTAILGNVDFASDMSSLDDVRPLLAEIRVTAERSAALTAQLLAFARRQVIEPKLLDVNALIGRAAPLLRRLLGDRITLSIGLAGIGYVRADASQLEQVFLNLITNARDSMPDGGSATLDTRDVDLTSADVAALADLSPGPYVQIAVSDGGAGIPAQALPQIFEPFFTTRRGGTGLGLATCYGIVKQSGGHIAVKSAPGAGTTFSVYLPRVEGALLPASDAPPVAESAIGRERVLVVEDEAAVRSIVERSLERAHYRIKVAASGDEALALANTEPAFDLLVTDVVMPGMNGWELGRRLRERWPSLKVLYISGYTEEVVKDGGVVGEGLSFLQKPFLPADLLTAIRQLLDAGGG